MVSQMPLLDLERLAEETNRGIQEGLAQGKVWGVDKGEKESAMVPRRGTLVVHDKSWCMPKGCAFQVWIVKQF